MKKFLGAVCVIVLASSAWAGGPRRALVQGAKAVIAKPSASVSIDVLMEEALLLGRKNAVSVLPTSQGIRTPVKLASVSRSALLDKSVRLQARLLLNSPLSSSEQQLFLSLYPFLPANTSFAMKNNDLMESNVSFFKKRTKFVNENRAEILKTLRVSPSASAQDYMTFVQKKDPRVILLGEMHYRPGIQREIASFLQTYQAAYPKRRIILFSEFLPSSMRGYWREGEPVPADFWTENPDYRRSLINLQAITSGVEIYGLENSAMTHKANRACGLDFVTANACLLSLAERNEAWAKVIEPVIERVSMQDPEAVFIVHAGNAHVDKTRFYSVSEKLRHLQPYVIQFTNGFQNSMLGYLLGQNPSYMARVANRYVLGWKEGETDFSPHIGFDLNVILPVSVKEFTPRKKE